MKLSKILRELAHGIYLDAVRHGLYEPFHGMAAAVKRRVLLYVIEDELVEAREAAEIGDEAGLREELADVIISAMSVGTAMGYDMGKAVMDKVRYNQGRSYRHQGEGGRHG